MFGLVLLLSTSGTSLAAQQSEGSVISERSSAAPSLFLVDSETRIQKLGWSFPAGSAIGGGRLRERVAVRGPGSFAWLRSLFDFLPGVSGPEYAPFSPIVLQRDVVRLRHLYRDAGFPRARVDYDVRLDTTTNRVGVTLIVDQGEPLTVDSIHVRVLDDSAPPEAWPLGGSGDGGSGSSEVDLPPELSDEWEAFVEDLGASRGSRFGQQERARLVNETTNWFLDRGYPWARASVTRADTVDTRVSVTLDAVPGPRAKVREIRIEGNERLSLDVLIREIPIRIGDWYDASRVSEGERELYQLELVRQALGGIVESQPSDSTVALQFRVNEGRPRLIWGRVGWRSASGVSAEAHWSHRNFLGGGRSLTVSTNAETGWAALEVNNPRTLGLSALVRQPYLIQRTMDGSFGPFVRFRDDFRDRSLLFGVESSLGYRKRALEAVTLQHQLSRLRVDDTYQLTPVREVVLQGDSTFTPTFVKSIFRLSGAYGTLDDRIDPRSGYLIEPSVQVTGPTGISDVEFLRVGVRSMTVIPVSTDATLFLRGTAGRLFPFGESDPERGVSRTRAIVGLRDVMFTAGGTSDVRGWASGLMGSKIPDVRVNSDGSVVANRYVPAGGLARLTGTAELGLPFPFLPRPHRSFLFFDTGRVWSPGDVFDPADPELRREGWAYAVGGGFEFRTLVGPVRLGAGYKLNPVPVDLLDPGDVARALVDQVPLSTLETKSLRRWHLHLSIGRGF